MTTTENSAAVARLMKELKEIRTEGIEGVTVKADTNNLFKWEAMIFGPPDTLYEGGYFKLLFDFPKDYPSSPPTVRFATQMWHPNIYSTGHVCVSILHPPGDDALAGELACERWSPSQTFRSIVLSVISMLNEPNDSSPANVDAAVMFRKWRDSKGVDVTYSTHIRRIVEATQIDAKRDQVTIPRTRDEYLETAPYHIERIRRRDSDESDDLGVEYDPNDDEDDDDFYQYDGHAVNADKSSESL